MNKIREFESLRGILAIAVVLQHSFSLLGLKSIFDLRHINMVYVFMILSGFVIFSLIDTQKEKFGIFILRRILRLYPVYCVCLGVSFFIIPVVYPLISLRLESIASGLLADTLSAPYAHLFVHLLFLQNFIPNKVLPNALHTILSPAWSISVEFHFYLLAPLFYFCIQKYFREKIRLFSICCLSFIILMSMITRFGHEDIFKYLFLFIVGIASYYFWKNYKSMLLLFPQLNKFVFPVLILMCSFFQPSYTMYAYLIWFTVFASALTVRHGVCSPFESWLSDFLHNPILSFFGKISYSVYLSHMIFMWLVLALLSMYFSELQGWAFYFSFSIPSFILTVIFSTILHYTVEMPCIRWGRKLNMKTQSLDSLTTQGF